jgi:TolB-like protein
MFASLVSLLLTASPTIAVVGLTPIDISGERADYVTEQLGVELVRQGLVVTTPADLRAVLGLERQRQLLGCSESSCLAELTGALGAEYVVPGQLARSSAGYRVTVKAVKASTGVAVFAWTTEQPTEGRAVSELTRCAAEFATSIGATPQRQLAVAPLVVGGVGGVAAAVGAGFLVSAAVAWGDLQKRGVEAVSQDRALVASRDGAVHQVVGFALVGAGVTALVAALIWGLKAGATPSSVSLLLVPDGARLGVGVRW